MGEPLHLCVSEHSPLLLVEAQGGIDAEATLGESLSLYDARAILLFARGVTTVTEAGRRAFGEWVRGLERRGNSLHVAECSPAFVGALDLADDLLGAHGSVVSALIPYRCEPCRRAQLDVARPATLLAGTVPPPGLCNLCGLPLTFAGVAPDYFHFLEVFGRRPSPPSVLQALARIDELRLSTRLGLLKELSSSRAPTLPVASPRLPRRS